MLKRGDKRVALAVRPVGVLLWGDLLVHDPREADLAHEPVPRAAVRALANLFTPQSCEELAVHGGGSGGTRDAFLQRSTTRLKAAPIRTESPRVIGWLSARSIFVRSGCGSSTRAQSLQMVCSSATTGLRYPM